MILTEEEAKTKRCQEGFGPQVPSVGGYAGAASPTHCIGSACMAWRWFQGIEAGSGRVVTHQEANGYCGKAGKP